MPFRQMKTDNLIDKKAGSKFVELPSWLQVEEAYEPRSDREGFLRASIDNILALLRRFTYMRGLSRDSVGGHPFLKLLQALLLSLLVAMATQASFMYFPLAWVLVELALLPGYLLVGIVKRSLLVVFLNFLLILPAYIFLGETRSFLLLVKVFITVTQMQIFALTTPWHQVIGSLRRMHVPSLFIFMLHISLKYIYLLGQTALALLYALRMRSVGYNADKGMRMGSLMGTLFIKSREEAQALYQAMLCRGFDGTYSARLEKIAWTWQDVLLVFVMLFMVYAFWLGGR